MNVIYKIVNTINNKIYIGSTTNFKRRRREHLNELKKDNHHSSKLQNSWNKYGKSIFIFIIIEEVYNQNNLIQREQFWFDKLNPFFNCCLVADRPEGLVRSEATKEKIRKSLNSYLKKNGSPNKGRKHTIESRENMSIAHKGKKLTKESIAKRTLKQSGKNHWGYKKHRPIKTTNLISKGLKKYYKTHKHPQSGRPHSIKAKEKIRLALSIPIYQTDIDGVIIQEWESSKKAAKNLKLHASNIVVCLKNNKFKTGGFKWKYKEK